MTVDEIDRILSSEEPLIPSSGFAASVMEAVIEAAAEPPSLPFPWLRGVAGAIACGASVGAGAIWLAGGDVAVWVERGIASAGIEAAVLLPQIGYAALALFTGAAALVIPRVRSEGP